MNEADLIQRAQAGDQEAFAELFIAHEEPLTRFAEGILENDANAVDAVRDSYEKAWAGIPRFTPGAQPSPWLHEIVKNVCLDKLREISKWVSLDDADDGDEAPDPRYREAEGGPPQEDRDGLLTPMLKEEAEREQQESLARHRGDVARRRADFLNRAEQAVQEWENNVLRGHGLRIVRDERAMKMLDELLTAGVCLLGNQFMSILKYCAECVDPQEEKFTREDARGAVKVLEHFARDFANAPAGSGYESVPGSIEKLLQIIRPVASRPGTKTRTHKDYLIIRLDTLFRKLSGGDTVDEALALALEMTYGKKVSRKGLPTEKRRAYGRIPP